MIRLAALCASAVALAPPAVAQVSKCTDAAGKVTYQQGPCEQAAKAEAIINGQRVSAEEIAAKQLAAAREAAERKAVTAARVKELRALLTDRDRENMHYFCLLTLKAGLKNPDSFKQDFVYPGVYPAAVLDDGSAVVMIDYHATNSFNAMIPGKQLCYFEYKGGRWSQNHERTYHR